MAAQLQNPAPTAVATPTRRVLGALDSNIALPSPNMLLSPSKKADLASSPRKSHGSRKSDAFVTELAPHSPGLKRKIGAIFRDGEEGVGDEKRVRIEVGAESVISGEERTGSPSSQQSPVSTRDESIFDAANESQNTVMTELDDEVLAAVPMPASVAVVTPVITAAQARATAQTLRLRLRLAQYKVATNQISIPLENLSIIPRYPQTHTSFTSHPTSNASTLADKRMQNASFTYGSGGGSSTHLSSESRLTAANVSRKRTPLPTARGSAEPSIPAANTAATRPKSAPYPLSISSSQESWQAGNAADVDAEPQSSPAKMGGGFATPMLPRSRDFVGNGCETPDLTSSVVKGRAADGLLKLMGGGN